jgi:hypothetical protein
MAGRRAADPVVRADAALPDPPFRETALANGWRPPT